MHEMAGQRAASKTKISCWNALACVQCTYTQQEMWLTSEGSERARQQQRSAHLVLSCTGVHRILVSLASQLACDLTANC